MATLLLQVAGSSLGAAVGGPIGAAIGRAIGGIAGYAIDNRGKSKDRVIDGPRLASSRILTSSEGEPVPRAYGQVRLGGEIIWATRFKEVIRTKKSDGGGKGGGGGGSVATKSYHYYANFAVGLCAGPITGIRRIWADGNELDLTKIEFRVYCGTDDQDPDPLIEAKQGLNNAPAYRGTAYVVFDNLALADYGNRIPQISVEVLRSVDELGAKIRSITVIPGTTEFGYHPANISRNFFWGKATSGNRNNSIAISDWKASLDELQMLCPNLESVALVVGWFGDDLRAEYCQVKPGIENTGNNFTDGNWQVSGTGAQGAHLVSKIGGKPAYGGTPSDNSVLAAIADLKERGLKVTIYPFILMDITGGNGLPDPEMGSEQPAFPWRGRITCYPGIGQAGTSDKTANATTQINQFCGAAMPGNFIQHSTGVNYLGPPEWSFRRQILHYANLCEVAGGVDGFIIGSEMKGLSSVRNDLGEFPFVDQLVALAQDVKTILRAGTKLTYAADWSEYFGYHPQDGSNDIYFNLDPLWALPEIDHIGIDNYMPVSDIRDDDPPDADGRISVDNLASQINSGEGYDWYYATGTDRAQRNRTPITDGAGEPWVWRYKDLVSWWQFPHHERINGVRQANPTAWVPQSKPFGFTELGCPAVNKGSNQPNVFVDPKSDQSDLPYFSSGGRDDLVQNRFLKAHLSHWDPGDPAFVETNNPVSILTGERMVPPSAITVWTWDARPFPWFPALAETWSDGPNWIQGHWLNGRLAGCPLDSLLAAIMKDFGFHNFQCSVDGYVDGFIVPDAGSLRSALSDLVAFFGVNAREQDGIVHLLGRNYAQRLVLAGDDLVLDGENTRQTISREHTTELPREALVNHGTVGGNYEQFGSKTRRIVDGSDRQLTMTLPVIMPPATASAIAEARIRDLWIGQETLRIGLPNRYLGIDVGDVVSVGNADSQKWLVEEVETGVFRTLKGRAVEDFEVLNRPETEFSSDLFLNPVVGMPVVELLDLPDLTLDGGSGVVTHFAVYGDPWAGSYAIASSPTDHGYEVRGSTNLPATIGELVADLGGGVEGRWDFSRTIQISLYSGALQSFNPLLVLNGANLLAVKADNGVWEVIQFRTADLQGDGSWKLGGLLRGQFGTEHAMKAGAAAGNRVVVIDEAVTPVTLQAFESGLNLNWLIGPAGEPLSSENYFATQSTNENIRQRPWSPVHLRVETLANGDLEISWIRRSRVNSDGWENAETPLDEKEERYLVAISLPGDPVLFEREVAEPRYTFSGADQLGVFGAGVSSLEIKVSQIGEGNRIGYSRSTIVSL